MNSPSSHPEHAQLLRLLDRDLDVAEESAVDTHLRDCSGCREELEEVRAVSADYQRFHESVLLAALPSPPHEWAVLDFAAVRSRSRAAVKVLALRPHAWIAAGAAIAASILALWLFQRPAGVKAAELLRKATVAERQTPIRRRTIQIETSKKKWHRPARLSGTDERQAPEDAELRRMFESAGYSWDDPLSAAGFALWHDRLPSKQDEVIDAPSRALVIHTTTAMNPITDAQLTLRATDLRAVACRLSFGAVETVEMTEVVEADEPPPAGTPPPRADLRPSPTPAPQRAAGPGDELRVIAALHRIGADLGEPVEVRREGGDITVQATGMAERRKAEIRSAVNGLAFVRLEFNEVAADGRPAVLSRQPPQPEAANPLFTELASAGPEGPSAAELSDQVGGSMEELIERAYALRSLARRFPPAIAAELSVSEKSTLAALARTTPVPHIARLPKSVGCLRRFFPRPARRGGREPNGPRSLSNCRTWHGGWIRRSMRREIRAISRAESASLPRPWPTSCGHWHK